MTAVLSRNREYNAGNPYQRDFKKVLCVCSAGLLRSPTAAWVLGQEPYNCNTRAVGVGQDYALIPIDAVHVAWADEILCMTEEHHKELMGLFPFLAKEGREGKPDVYVLGIPDNFAYRDPELVRLIKEAYDNKLRGQMDEGFG